MAVLDLTPSWEVEYDLSERVRITGITHGEGEESDVVSGVMLLRPLLYRNRRDIKAVCLILRGVGQEVRMGTRDLDAWLLQRVDLLKVAPSDGEVQRGRALTSFDLLGGDPAGTLSCLLYTSDAADD